MSEPACVHITTVSRRSGRRRRYAYFVGLGSYGRPSDCERFTARAPAEARASELAVRHGLLVQEARHGSDPLLDRMVTQSVRAASPMTMAGSAADWAAIG